MSGSKALSDFEFQLQAERLHAESGTEGGWNKQQTYTDPSDGTVYEWDEERKGWFPKIDDDFLAAYQASYGVAQPETTPTDPTQLPPIPAQQRVTEQTETEKQSESGTTAATGSDGSELTRKRKQEDNSGGWFDIDDTKNHNVYVSGMPHDMTLEEFADLMSKYGIVMEDDEGEPKVKLYRDVNGEIKGDGLCCYLKIESVALALQLLDGLELRGHTISAEKAKFHQKGNYNPSLKKRLAKKKKKGKFTGQEKLLDWRERRTTTATENISKFDKVVIISHAFHPKEFEEDPMLINEIRDDLRGECEKFGPVKKILLFDRHPGGVASVGFKEAESASACVGAMNGRWYAGRQLNVCVWDGVTNYQVEETEKEREERLTEWEKFLEDEEASEKGGTTATSRDTETKSRIELERKESSES